MNKKINLLAIETTGPLASVALINEKEELVEIGSEQKMSHLQHLMPMIGNLLESCQLRIDDLTHIAVSEGPGSFTGIRIGMATAKALAQALDLPTIGVPTLASFAYHRQEDAGLICPILDARREQVYAGVYHWEGTQLVQDVLDRAYQVEDLVGEIERLDAKLRESIRFYGDGILVYQEAIQSLMKEGSPEFADEVERNQKATSVAKLAYQRLKEGKIGDYRSLSPVYLRKAEAERRLEEKQKQETNG